MKRKTALDSAIKNVYVVLQKMFYMRISEFSMEVFAIFLPEFFFSIYTKDCIYVEMAEIHQNLIFHFFQISITCASTSQNI
jgi:hypothetical protein